MTASETSNGQADHEIIEISTDRLSLGVAPDVGAGVVWLRSLENGNVTWRWLREPETGRPLVPSELGCFLLVPFSNRIAYGRFNVEGRDVQLAANFAPEPHMIHGVGWRARWRVSEQRSDAITLQLDWDGADWPWRFAAHVRYALTDTALVAALSVRNDDTSPMPCGLGFHPYFPRSEGVRLSLEARAVVLNDADMVPHSLAETHDALPVLRSGDPLPYGLDNGLAGWTGAATIGWPGRPIGMRMQTEPEAHWAVLFTPSQRDWFCFEPVTHQTNAHNGPLPGISETGLKLLAPGETQSFEMRLGLHETTGVDARG